MGLRPGSAIGAPTTKLERRRCRRKLRRCGTAGAGRALSPEPIIGRAGGPDVASAQVGRRKTARRVRYGNLSGVESSRGLGGSRASPRTSIRAHVRAQPTDRARRVREGPKDRTAASKHLGHAQCRPRRRDRSRLRPMSHGPGGLRSGNRTSGVAAFRAGSSLGGFCDRRGVLSFRDECHDLGTEHEIGHTSKVLRTLAA